jgi:hypothetical protein
MDCPRTPSDADAAWTSCGRPGAPEPAAQDDVEPALLYLEAERAFVLAEGGEGLARR